MFRKAVIINLLVIVSCTSGAWASDADYYITVGRTLMFDGTLSGLRLAYETFENGLNDAGCPDCNTSRELRFLRAVTGTAMLVIRDDNSSVDSVFELARQFGIEVLGDYWALYFEPLGLDLSIVRNQYDAYEIPDGAPDANEIRNIIDTSMIPEIETLIADLNSIGDSPGDRFKVFLDPGEIRTFFHPNSPVFDPGSLDYDPNSRFLHPLEVDYGEVLLLKGMLMCLKGQLQTQVAYDLYIDANDILIEKIYGDSFNIYSDLLDPYPDLLKVLPTANDSNDGAAILAQAAQDWIDAINYYLDAIDYISNEDTPPGTDPQDDEFLYIDPNDKDVPDTINAKLTTVRDSLINDTMETYVFETTKTYDVRCSSSNSIGRLELVYDLIGLESGGNLILDQCAGVPSQWDFENFIIDGNELYIEMDYEDCGINYMYAQSLNSAKSVLFTPVDCGADPNTYKCELLTESLFSATGTAQSWYGYNQSWLYSLPFTFQFFGTAYTSVYVCTNGFLDFADSGYYHWDLENKIRIEPFGADLRTDGGGSYDVYIEQVDANEVKFRWDADYSGNQCNFSVSLFSNGSIRFDYGPGNNNAWPYVGISNGSYDSCIKLYGGYGSGLFYGTISQDQNSISNATFEYWGNPSGTLTSLSGQIVAVEVQDVNIDFNPVFGSSVHYPNPVNPRDLLPVFDEWHAAQPNTIGHGLGDDATLGGILPDMTQYDWRVLLNLQPSGLFYLDFISPWQVVVDGNTTDWNEDQLVLADIAGDTDEDSNEVNGVDIENLYMAYDWENIYGAITLYDDIGDGSYYYNLYMSYSPDDDSTLGAIRLEIYVSGGFASGSLYSMDAPYGYPYWDYLTSCEASAGQNAIEFKVPFSDLPADLPGRFIAVESSGWDSMWYEYDGEENLTHLRIGDVGTISGTISYNGYRGAPIFVQAFTDPEEPEESIVASTMITEPGPYTLEGVGLGWRGYVRAFTPLFGFNVFDLDALSIESRVPVFLMDRRLDGVDIVLNNPTLLEKDVWESGEINADIREIDWYAFDAVQGGTYTLDLTRGTSNYASLTLFDRNGYEELEELYYWQTQQIIWFCPVSGRYYVKVAEDYYLAEGGTYQVRMTSDITCPQADIASADWVGVKDCRVDFYDLAVLISHWLDSCSEPYWCDCSDFDESNLVDFGDFAFLANEWFEDGMP